ncbi:hypothetical protein [Kocuria rosea]|uniref:Uncharacterized protein n=1 Tax=Kocuria rosea TaxID=1275 RepID=A0A4R5YP40_KOCRO|nr:hypothetical protein [Kocuria rosea]TDL46511.1 hypothetical protein E2R59_00350 [Kocuria rosea]
MSTPPENPGHHSHPYEPTRSTPPRAAPAEWPAGAGPGQQRGAVPAPRQLKRLLGLTMASGALYTALGVVVTVIFATTDFAAMYQRMGVPAEDARQVGTMVEQMRGISIASGVIAIVVLAGLYATAYVFLKKGANWARITCTVLAILSSLGFLGNLFGFWLYGQWAIVLIALGVAFIAVNIAWLVTAFQAPVRDWFTQPRYPR